VLLATRTRERLEAVRERLEAVRDDIVACE
jgi:hypothetical protein